MSTSTSDSDAIAGSKKQPPNQTPPAFAADLSSALSRRAAADHPETSPPPPEADGSTEKRQPNVLVTNAEGIGSPGLAALVSALAGAAPCDVFVCAPDSDKSVCGHAVTVRETVAATSAEFAGAVAFEVSGTAADCVSLALSGALFSWSRPALVISGINRGLVSGHQSFYSGAVAGAREASMCGVPSMAISLDWKKNGSQESDFEEAASVCLPLMLAAVRDIAKGLFPKCCLLNIGIPSSPSSNKGLMLTRQSVWRSAASWQAVSANRNPAAAQFMSMHQSLGIQLAQLGRDASAAGAARRINAQKKNVEIESMSSAGKPDTREVIKKFFRMEFLDKEQEDLGEDLDFRALEKGFVAVTPLQLQIEIEPMLQESVSEWLSSVLHQDENAP